MKKLLGIIVLGLLLSGNAYAEMESLQKGTTVNQLLKDGYKLIDTDSIGYSEGDGYGAVGTFYHLMKKNELVTCVAGKGEISCWKP
tara:strand:- start:232 stop:489 length:258 start_codon:yes stop_codon:yes gene_type:complete